MNFKVDQDTQELLKISKIFEKMSSIEEEGTEDYDYKRDKMDSKWNIVDLLENTNYARDVKIDYMDRILTQLFKENRVKLEGDKVTFIGSTFMKYGEKEPYLNHCLVLGGCDDVDGAVIETHETEENLLMAWKDLILEEDPDIIIGYNIFGFDYEFIFRRTQEHNCEKEFLQLSRKIQCNVIK